MEGNQTFLHGTLEVTIFHATPYTPPFLFNCIQSNGSPTYVTIKIDNNKVAKTSHERDRVWNQTFQILCAHPLDSIITITMKTKCSVLGKFHLKAEKIATETSFINGFFPLISTDKKNSELKLRFMLWFKPATLEQTWSQVISNEGYQGIRNASFPLRSNCGVTLYQDAHHGIEFQPPFELCGSPRRLWEDIYKAIEDAKYLVYIAGWSFNPNMALVRDPETSMQEGIGVKLGELLKRKAEQGVAVRIMVWDDETSLPFIKNRGVMGTHDEDAFSYFKHTKVICKLCPRLHHKFPTLFTHHQKTLTVDSNSGRLDGREIVSFIGGLDFCDGRFDTDQHSLFRTLNKECHCYDFYQTSISGAGIQRGGPREPWHDVHACVVGEAAWDVLSNFEQRWTKQCDPSLLLPTSSLSHLLRVPKAGRNWNVQVFRSIDHVSAAQMPHNQKVEQSIHEAYVEAIRKADRFIYIENQYFIGGCHMWDRDQGCGCRNLVPIEISLKIVQKIRQKKMFAVYIVIPMWPEGHPESDAVHDILHWTRETMAMMYRIIGEALQECGEPAHPKDYLNFFCLANREMESPQEFVPPYSPHPSTQYWLAQKHRRFMVYVHSKLMIVDDAYILIGSANVNQRSMDGQRDTEIAIGCYQRKTTMIMNTDLNSNGYRYSHDIQKYRMSLWYEHTGGLANRDFLDPRSLECVRKVCSIGDQMWEMYIGDEVVDMGGAHLVSYPVNVTKEGILEDLNVHNGDDTQTLIKGRRSKIMPPIFTT
ncbi:Phospholipase D alpha 4 [Linum perenne]